MSRHKGRVIAFQALYSADVGNKGLEELLPLNWIDGTLDQETTDFARMLIAGALNHGEEIDALIKNHLSEKWDFERINKVSLAILRLSVFSLLYQQEIAPSIVIDEAISIAKDFGTDDSFRFINAVLDTIRKEGAG